MFDSIRNHKKYLMGFLMILIIPSFVLFGVQGFTERDARGPVVATVDGSDITRQEWDQAHQNESRRLRDEMPGLDPKLLDSEEARYATLEQLVRQRVLTLAAQKLNLYTSDQRLARHLQDNETIASLRRPDGTLDVEAYRQLVGRQGMTPEMFEAQVRADLSQRQVLRGVLDSGFAPKELANVSLDAFFERREIRVERFAASDFADRVVLSEADIEAFYNANQALFQSEEQADVEYLVLDVAALQQGIALPEADVRAYYEQNAARLSGNEERRASHILLTVPASASAEEKEAVRQRAAELLAQVRQAPENFAAVAKAQSQDPGSAANGGDLDFFGRGAMVKPFEEAVFALEKGAISDLVETEFGFHIIQLTDVKAPPRRSFDEMRAEIEADLKKQQAQKQFADTAETFSNLVYEQGDSLQPAAERLNLKVQTFKGLKRQPQPDAGVLANERLLEALFSPASIESKRNTEAVETASGQLVSARIVQHSSARTLPLAEVREVVRTRLVAQRAAELAREAGEQRLAAGKASGDTTGLSAPVTVSRDNAQGFAGPVLNAVLSAGVQQLPTWVGVPQGAQGYTVVQVLKVEPRPSREAQVAAQAVQQFEQWVSALEADAYYQALKDRFKVKIEVPAPAAGR